MEDERCLGKRLVSLDHRIRRYLDQVTREYEVTGMQGHVLHYICFRSQYGPVYQKDVEDEFHVRRSTATGILKLMERNGLIEKESVAEDMRLKRLCATARGVECARRMEEAIARVDQQLLLGLTKEEIRVFQEVLKKIADNVDHAAY